MVKIDRLIDSTDQELTVEEMVEAGLFYYNFHMSEVDIQCSQSFILGEVVDSDLASVCILINKENFDEDMDDHLRKYLSKENFAQIKYILIECFAHIGVDRSLWSDDDDQSWVDTIRHLKTLGSKSLYEQFVRFKG